MKLALLADLHFGSVPEGLPALLREAVESATPDLIVIAGDLTLRARRKEFEQVGNWLKSLTLPTLLLPGNHDLPYWNLLRRFADPFHHYREISGVDTLMPTVTTKDGFVLGFNTTRSWQPHIQWQEGVARREDIEAARETLSKVPKSLLKAVVAHHPFTKIPNLPRAKPVRRATPALEAFSECGVTLVMSGHTHRSFAVEFEIAGRSIVVIGAPTALSLRQRGEVNGFWIIETVSNVIKSTLWLRRTSGFEQSDEKTFYLT